MVIQSWFIVGLIAGGLVGLMMGRKYGLAGDILFGIIGGLVGGSLASILFVVSGILNETSFIALVVMSGAMLLMLVSRMLHPRST